MNSKSDSGRRRFLKGSAALGLATGVAPVVNAHDTTDKLALNSYGARSRFVTTKRISDGGDNCSFASDCNTLTPLQDSVGIITPSPLHFIGSHGAYPPDINPDEFELAIHGLVERPMKFSLAALKRLPFITQINFIECEANSPMPQDITVQDSHGKTACSEWTGVPLSILFDEVGVKSNATWFVAEGADRDLHSKSIPVARVEDCYLAYGQNGEPLMPHQGYPLRLMVPGYGGFSHVKWLTRIKLVEEPLLTPYERFRGKYGPKSVVTYPSGGQKIEKGFQTITGLAWSGSGAVSSVQVSTDDGNSWREAKLHGPVLPIAHTRFSIDWNWDGRESTIMSRCVDDKGLVQPTAVELANSAGVTLDEVLSKRYRGNYQWNLIFPWKVASDGSVQQTLLS